MPDENEAPNAPTGDETPPEAAPAAPQPAQEAPGKKRKGRQSKGAAKGRKPRGPIDLSKVSGVVAPETPSEAAPASEQGAEATTSVPSEGSPSAAASAAETAAPPGDAEPSTEPVATSEAEPEAGGEEEPEADGAPSDLHLRAAVEAIIFAADEPVTPAAIAKAIGGVKPSAVKKAIEDIRAAREATHSGLALEEIAGGYTFLTREEFAPAIRRLRKAAEGRKLTAAALETLAVVAYKQPILKQQIEDIRGVSCGPMLRTLMEQDLVKIVGRADVLGRPLLYGTTKRFLDVFGLASLKDLPKTSELAPG